MNFHKTLLTGLFLYCSSASLALQAAPHWTYEEQDIWGEIPDLTTKPPYPYAECSLGTRQSPINLDNAQHTDAVNQIKPHYEPRPLRVTNNGHTLVVSQETGNYGSLRIGKDRYELIQFHFHAPSEHAIGTDPNKTEYPLETHFVHFAPDGKVAVIGIFAVEGASNPLFEQILQLAEKGGKNGALAVGESGSSASGKINPTELLPKNTTRFYTYAGSLTTPPCTEGVRWTVLKKPIEVSADQIARFKAFLSEPGNARDLQPLNGGRVVLEKVGSDSGQGIDHDPTHNDIQ